MAIVLVPLIGLAASAVRGALRRHGVAPERLTLEITETVLLADLTPIAEHLHALRAVGVRVAIDDLGTGYTSLTHLGSLPADVLEIDRSLVVGASTTEAQAHVVGLLVGTAHALAMTVTAEGSRPRSSTTRCSPSAATTSRASPSGRPCRPRR